MQTQTSYWKEQAHPQVVVHSSFLLNMEMPMPKHLHAQAKVLPAFFFLVALHEQQLIGCFVKPDIISVFTDSRFAFVARFFLHMFTDKS